MVLAEDCILITDKFPKAAHHALVLPRDATLHDVCSLTRMHIPLLTSMKVGLVQVMFLQRSFMSCGQLHKVLPLFWAGNALALSR